MPDMPTAFWSGWIIVLTIGSVSGLLWLIFTIYYSNSSPKEFKSPVWDENLQEGNNPAPMWWFWMILTALVLSAAYLMLYPGLGSFSGALKWSQSGRLDKKLILYAYEHTDMKKKIAQMSIEELKQNEELMGSAKRVFNQNCIACHGEGGRGQAMRFPNLVDNDWQWGGTIDDIEHSIRHGRIAVMVGWQAVLGDDGVSDVVNYIKDLGSASHNTTAVTGKDLYQQFCVACHGVNGEGNQSLGAPNLSDDIWLYGNTDDQLFHTISVGRSGKMPSFDKRLSDLEVKLLVAWLAR
ncbi:MAG: cytochrome-c oxidase, cbb3-type subunit III [Gammaproteobacteria bacterium]|nr:cytochrome-c oxidase, cbb3-type subunit III [Gammaproteobacteria bacterium]